MIKTEQELKDALEDIFFDALTDKSNPPYYTDKVDPENDGYWQCKVYELCADELIKRGYGDISEYKAEIESLKNANIELVDNLVFYKDKSYKLEKNVDKLKTEIRQEVKQAQIEILGKLKERIKTAIDTYWNSNGGGYYFAEDAIDDIDEMIEDVKRNDD